MSKTSKRRPGDDKAFADGWERIFKKDAQAGQNALQAITETNEGLGLYDEEFTAPKLGPCKFCGSSDVDGPHSYDQIKPYWHAHCNNCPAQMTIQNENVDALFDAWGCVEKTCGNCKHWESPWPGMDMNCKSTAVESMMDGDTQVVSFKTTVNFGCNHWEPK